MLRYLPFGYYDSDCTSKVRCLVGVNMTDRGFE